VFPPTQIYDQKIACLRELQFQDNNVAFYGQKHRYKYAIAMYINNQWWIKVDII